MAIRKKSLMMVVGLLCAGSSMQGMQHGGRRPIEAYDSEGKAFLLTMLSADRTKYIPMERDGNGGIRPISGLQFDEATQRWVTAAPAIVVTPKPAQEEQPEIAPEAALPHSGSLESINSAGRAKRQPLVAPQPEAQQEQAASDAGQAGENNSSAPQSPTSSPSASRRSSVASVKEEVKDLLSRDAQGADDAQSEAEAGSLSVSENEARSGSEADREDGAVSPVKRRRGRIDQEGSASGDEDAQGGKRGGGKLEGKAKRAKRGPSEDEEVRRFGTEGDQELSGLEEDGQEGEAGAGEQSQEGEAGAGTAGEQPQEQSEDKENKKEDLNKTENAPKCSWNKVKTPVAFCAVALVTYCGYRLHQWWKGNAASSDVSEDDSLDKNGGSEL